MSDAERELAEVDAILAEFVDGFPSMLRRDVALRRLIDERDDAAAGYPIENAGARALDELASALDDLEADCNSVGEAIREARAAIANTRRAAVARSAS